MQSVPKNVLFVALLICSTISGWAATPEESQNPLLKKLVWTGDGEVTSAEIESVAQVVSQTDWVAFIEKHPHSPWTPSLRHLYAQSCRASGQYSIALEQWAKAWDETKSLTTRNGRLLADRILTGWMEQLSVLGRSEQLSKLFEETKTRRIEDAESRRLYLRAREAFDMMTNHPGMAFRCGTLALANVGRELFGPTKEVEALVDLPSPSTGFSMAALAKLSDEHKLGLVPVHRKGNEIIVPSVVHWKDNHYAAILREVEKGYFLVSDPTFGKARYLTASTINKECSGYFFVPATKCPATWEKVAGEEIEKIFGKGVNNAVKDGDDHGCLKDPSGKVYACIPCNKKKGMPAWWVSEPYINLWLGDEPLAYRTSSGDEIAFGLNYKQRDTRPNIGGAQGRAPQAQWNMNWFSFIDVTEEPILNQGNYKFWVATVYNPEGGATEYSYFTPNDEASRTRLEPVWGGLSQRPQVGVETNSLVSGFRLIYPDGSQDIYGTFFDEINPDPGHYPAQGRAFLTKQIDSLGRTNRFLYESAPPLYRLKYMVDYDGKTNTIFYNSSNLVSQVQSPYGQNCYFYYNTNGFLTNIVDVVGLSTTIFYDENSWPTNLTTPYGTTSFSYIANTNFAAYDPVTNNVGGHSLNRAVEVTEPNLGKQLFLYRFENNLLPASYYSNEVPTNSPYASMDNGGGSTFQSLIYRNSFHWNQKQYAGLSTTDAESFTADDYLLGRMKHWLADSNNVYVTGYISIERDASPDGTLDGQKTWYDYGGKGANYREGTNSADRVIARVLPDGSTQYTWSVHNKDGFPTKVVSTYTTTNDTIALRTNSFAYGTNITTYQWNQNGVTYLTHYSTNLNLLLSVTNWNGQVSESYGGFVTNTVVTFLNNVTAGNNTNTVTFAFIQPGLATNGLGEVTSYTYGTQRRITSVRIPSGLTITNQYAADGTLSANIALEIQRTNRFAYFTNNLLQTWTNELGLVRGFAWDALLRPTNITFPDTSNIQILWNNLDVSGIKNREDQWRRFGYNSLRQLTSFTNELTQVTRFSYCDCGSLESITNALNQVTTYIYDNQLQLKQITYPDTSSVFLNRNSIGQVTNYVSTDGTSITNWFNNQGLFKTSSNAFGQISKYVYNILDQPIRVTDANNVTTTNTFDILDRTLSRTYPDLGVEKFVYSTNGLVAYTNELGTNFWIVSNDAASRPTNILNPNSELLQFFYNAAGNITKLFDGKTNATTWGFDEFGRMTSKTNAQNSKVLGLNYNRNGEVTNRWTPQKLDTFFAYDAAGNLTNIDHYSTADIRVKYDALNRFTNVVKVGQFTNAFTFTSFGALETEDGPWNSDTITFSYVNQRQSGFNLAHSTGTWAESYTYDNAGRLETLTSPAGDFTYTYDPVRQLNTKMLELPNGAYITNAYDSVARQTGTWLRNSTNGLLNFHGYVFNKAGQRTSQTRWDTSFVDYGYDKLGQLISAQGTEGNAVTVRFNEKFGYKYDKAGNLNQRTNNQLVQTFTTDTINQLSSGTRSGTLTVAGSTTSPATNVTVNTTNSATRYADGTFAASGFTLADGTNTFSVVADDTYGRHATRSLTINLPANVTFQYDLNGNLTNDGRRLFGYDDQNQLTSVTVSNEWKSEFGYDGLSRRIQTKEYGWSGGTWVQTNEVRYVYNGVLPIQERDSNNVPQITYTRGLDISGSFDDAGGIGGLLAMTRTEGDNPAFAAHSYYHADGGGNISALINERQAIVARAAYDPFGNFLYRVGPMAGVNKIWFSSMPFDTKSGLSTFLYRNYDANLQRWLNQDPIGEAGGINLYAYVKNRPVNAVDPFGFSDFNRPPGSISATDYRDWGGRIGQPVANEGQPSTEPMINGSDDMANKGMEGPLALTDLPGFLDWAGDQTGMNQTLGMKPSEMMMALGGVLPDWPTPGTCPAALESAKPALTPEQLANLGRFEKKLPANASPTKVFDLPNGGKAFQADSASKNIPGSFAQYEKQVDAAGNTLQYTKTTFGPNGDVIHVKDKINGGTFTPGQ